MEQIHSKSSVSPASGYSFPSIDKENPSMFNEGIPNKPGVKDGFESASKDKSNWKVGSGDSKIRPPLGHDIDVDPQFLPKTGIQERFLQNRPIFKGSYSEYEHLGYEPSPELAEVYKKRMEDSSNVGKEVVYDSMELSPYYNNSGSPEERYFDESQYVHPVVTDQDRKPGAYAPEGYFKFKEASNTHGVMRYYSKLNTYYKLKDEYDDTLIFESR